MKVSFYCPFKILSIAKNTWCKKYNFKPLHGQKYAENCGIDALKLRTSVKIAIAEVRNWGCGATFLFKVAELRLRKCFLPVAELRLRTQKIVARAHLWMTTDCTEDQGRVDDCSVYCTDGISRFYTFL
jgi:hypothetical protein